MGRGARDGKDVSARIMGFKSIPVVVVAQSDQRKGRPSKAHPVHRHRTLTPIFPSHHHGPMILPFQPLPQSLPSPFFRLPSCSLVILISPFFGNPIPLLLARSALFLISSPYRPSKRSLRSDPIRAELTLAELYVDLGSPFYDVVG
jgi:hypothetical protein